MVWDRFRKRAGDRAAAASARIFFLVEIFNLLVILLLIQRLFKTETLLSVFAAQITYPQGLFFLCLYFTAHALWKVWRSPTSSLAVPEAALGIYAAVSSVRVMMDLAPSLYSYSVIFNAPPYLVFVILVTRVIRWAGPSLEPRNRNLLAGCLLGPVAALHFVALLPDPRRLPTPLKTDIGTFYTKTDVALLFPQIISFMKTHTKNGKDILGRTRTAQPLCFCRDAVSDSLVFFVTGSIGSRA